MDLDKQQFGLHGMKDTVTLRPSTSMNVVDIYYISDNIIPGLEETEAGGVTKSTDIKDILLRTNTNGKSNNK